MDKKTLRDYNWMIHEIKRQRDLLENAGTNLVAQSGIESAFSKAQGEVGDPVLKRWSEGTRHINGLTKFSIFNKNKCHPKFSKSLHPDGGWLFWAGGGSSKGRNKSKEEDNVEKNVFVVNSAVDAVAVA
ncbi:UNVERIFIED_CONTAM: hypothetical protein N8J90_11710 [Halobacillus marinus]|uniref:hypothetical protein n=1 Tax=Halobacillus sp. BAB-2008 TaxID=1246484 RepID=UPI0002A4D79A|nr:hypothetical protein [Halobacillus sp. BAB-2008]ELK44189.1 hypothetical protein D479_20113 [Halobacillus sp. BAB-2008]